MQPQDVLASTQLKDVLTLTFDRWSATQTLWNFYLLAVGGIVTFAVSSGGLYPILKYPIALIFLFFAASNLSSMLKVMDERRLLLSMIPAGSPYAPAWQKQLKVQSSSSFIAFHLFLDAVTLLVIFARLILMFAPLKIG